MSESKNMMALYICVTSVDEKQFAGDFFNARQHAEDLVTHIVKKYELGLDASGSRVAYINNELPTSTLIKAQKDIIQTLKQKLPLGIEAKCFINIDVGMGLVFPLDMTDDGEDYTTRWDYSQAKNLAAIEIFADQNAVHEFFKDKSDPVEPIVFIESVA